MITYNHERFVEQAISGILSQNIDFSVQLVISDDFSSDSTIQKISSLLDSTETEISIDLFFQEQNLGIIENFVFALQKCRGKYIAICEGDDFWIDDNKLINQLRLVEADPDLVGSFHKVKVVYDDKPYLSGEYSSDVSEILHTRDLIADKSLIHTSSLFFRKDALIFPEWYFSMLSGDFALTSILSAYGPFRKVDKFMSTYRVHGGGVTNSPAYNRDNIDLKMNILSKLNEFHNFKYQTEFLAVINKLYLRKTENVNILTWLRRKLRLGLVVKRLGFFIKQL